ncbi:MAG TPA: DNA mismatch repair protein MutT [Desulfobacteraceae bacterium]|nr:DNA mismatch repair protein MutT [Desulfobacteraceae bacterium]
MVPSCDSNPNSSRFTHCPDCGRPDLKADSFKSFACRSCGFQFFINCAAAVMGLILDDKNRLLVTRRKYAPARGSLDLPGGFADPGEGIEESLKRELAEELNLKAVEMTYLCSYPNTYTYGPVTYPITDMAFICRVESFGAIQANDDVADFLFIPVNALDPLRFGMASARKVISRFKQFSAIKGTE